MTPPTLVLLAGPGRNARILFNALQEAFPIAAVILEDRAPRMTFLERRFRRLGAAKVLGQLCFRATVVPALNLICRRRVREIEHLNRLSDRPIPLSKIWKVRSINDSQTAEFVREVQPAIIVLSGTRLLSASLLADLTAPVLNIHAGITPLYRGVHGAYWALTQNDTDHCGVTIHLVDEGIDTGGILAQTRIHPTADDSFVTYPLVQLAAAIPLLKETIFSLSRAEADTIDPPRGGSRLWSHPTLTEYLRLRWSIGVR